MRLPREGWHFVTGARRTLARRGVWALGMEESSGDFVVTHIPSGRASFRHVHRAACEVFMQNAVHAERVTDVCSPCPVGRLARRHADDCKGSQCRDGMARHAGEVEAVTADPSLDCGALISPELAADPEAARRVAAEPATPLDPWLERRQEGFGASEIGALYIALGLRAPSEGDPKYLLDAAQRLFAVKARLRKPKAAGSAAAGGQRRERDVLRDWTDRGCPGSDVTPWSVRHADELPKEYLPLVDRYVPRLTCTPDGYARDGSERLVHVEVKTTWRRDDERHMTGELWWGYRLQVLAGIAVTAAHSGVCVVGLGYASDDDGSLCVFPVERDAEEIARIRDACIEGWKRVEAMKARKT